MNKLLFKNVFAAVRVILPAALSMMCLCAACTKSGVDETTKDPSDQTDGNGDDDNQTSSGAVTETVNREFTHYVMDKYYLWNDAYRRTTRNFKQNYDKFLEDVLAQMYYKQENLKDGHMYSDGWSFYSYIDRWLSSRATRVPSKNDDDDYTVEKENYYGFGMYCAYTASGSKVYFIPLWVYPDSPAAKAGIKRGDLIGKVDGKSITKSNMLTTYGDIFYDEFSRAKTYTLSVEHSDGSTENITVSTDDYYPTPVLYDAVYSVKGKIAGYLVYNSFDAAYDDELTEVFDRFKAAGVEDVIIDLRYNGGGYVTSSNLIASAMAGAVCIDKAFTHYLYNAERMKNDYGITDLSDATKFPADKFRTKYAEKYGFGNIYIIGTENTASASELLINALRGVDRQVKVVGNERTNGKDVGMEVMETTKTYSNYRYEIAAITFQTFNAKGESDYDDGFAPDIEPALLQATDGNFYPYEAFMPEDWGTMYIIKEDGSVLAIDYLMDALMDIGGGTLASGDLEIISASAGEAQAAVRGSRVNEHRLLPAATRSGEGGRLMPRKDPRRENMFKYVKLGNEEF